METSCVARLVAIVLGATGCGADAEIAKSICDPSQPGAGRVAVETRTTGLFARGQAVMFDNGAPYLFVDGQCNYWVSNPSDLWGETRSGVLDVAAAADVGARLHLGAWSDLRGTWSDPSGGVFDAPVLIADDGTSSVICTDLCDAPEIAASVRAMYHEVPVVAQELWDRGSAIDSAVRAIAITREPGSSLPVVEWPLSRPITDFVRTGDPDFGEGTLEDDMASARALKELRASFLRGDHGAFVWNALPVMSDGAYYLLYLRDALPFEDESGLVPLTLHVDSP